MQPCIQEQEIGKIKEFMEQSKGLKATMFTAVMAIVIQIVTFGFLWGSLTQTVKQNTEQIWKCNTPAITDNTRNIDKILAKFELIQVIRGATGQQGIQGIPGKDAK